VVTDRETGLALDSVQLNIAPSLHAVSDSGGGFVFPAVAPGEHNVHVFRRGYAHAGHRISVEQAAVETLRVALRPQPCDVVTF
jgi:hypothetical protein